MERKIYLEPTKLTDALTVKELFCVHSYLYPPTFNFEGESHEAMELVYVQSGSTVVTTNSYTTVLNQGDLIVHRPWDFHKIRANNTTCRMFIFSFSLSRHSAYKYIVDRVYSTTDVDKFFISNMLHKGVVLVAGKNGKPKTNKRPEYGDSQIVKNYLELLLINIANSKIYKNKTTTSQKIVPTSPVVAKVIKYLEDHVYETVTLEKIAKSVGYSVSRISYVFKKEMGDSIIHYLIKMKMKKACELLTSGEKSIKNISAMLSFDTVQYFSLQFKKIIGITPAQFRDEIKTDRSYLETDFAKVESSVPYTSDDDEE